MRLTLLALVAVMAVTLPAEASPVVKIASFPCEKPYRAKFGSAVMFEREGKVYAVTSDHVLFHGDSDEGICHRLYSDKDSRPKAAHLKAVNLGRGLGLLEVEPHPDSGALAYARIVENAGKLAEGFAEVCGYPHGSQRLFCDKNGQVLNAKSDRTLLPLVHEVIEVSGHNEYGMSGGGLFAPDGSLRGILSHQYLQLTLGGPAKLLESSEGMVAGQLIVLGLPLPGVVDWLERYFAGAPADLRYVVAEQLRGKSVLSLAGVRLTPRECAPAPTWGDPVGIGGDVAVEGKICDVVLSIEKGSATHPWPFGPRPWFQRTKEKLQAGGTAVITGLFHQGKKYPLKSFLNLLTKIEANITPTLRFTDPFTEPQAVVTELLSLVPRLKSRAAELRLKFQDDLMVRDVLDQVLIVGEACESRQFELVDLQDLKRLLEDKSWKEMMVEELELTVELKGALYKIRELLAKIQG